jgi:hypothetical protein
MHFIARWCRQLLSHALSGSPAARVVVQAAVFAIMLSAVPTRAAGATTGVTINNATPLTSPFLPSATSASQVGNSPAWKADTQVLGLTTYTENLEVLTPGAAVNLDYATQRTKRITLNQNTTFTPVNIPTASTNIQTMLVEVIGDGAFTVAFSGVTFQTAFLAIPPASTVTYYGLRADAGVVRGYCDVRGGTNVIVQQIGPGTIDYIPKWTGTNTIGDSIMSQPGGIDITDTRASTGTNVVFNVTTSQVMTNGDRLFQIGNAGNPVQWTAFDGSIVIGQNAGTAGDGTSFAVIKEQTLESTYMANLMQVLTNGFPSSLAFTELDGSFVNHLLQYGAVDSGGTTTELRNLQTQIDASTVRFGSASITGGNPSVNLFKFEPTIADGNTPYLMDTFAVHTTGNLLEVSNNGTPELTVAAGSGYDGTGTHFLSDDGTYKTSTFTNVADAVWINQAGVVSLVPGNTNYVVNIVSQSPDNPTNAVLVVDTAAVQTDSGASLAVFKNAGTNVFNFHPEGTFEIPDNDFDNAVIATGRDLFFSLYSTGTDMALIMGQTTGSKTFMNLYPVTPDGVSPYTFNTSLTHTSGNLLEVANNGTNIYTFTAGDFADFKITNPAGGGVADFKLDSSGEFAYLAGGHTSLSLLASNNVGLVVWRNPVGVAPSVADFDLAGPNFGTQFRDLGLSRNASVAGVVSANSVVVTNSLVTLPLTVTYASSLTVDFSENSSRWTVLGGDLTLASSNLSPGRGVTYRIDNQTATNCNVILPSGWRFVSGVVTNVLAASKIGLLSALSYSTTDTNVVATWSSE